MDFYNTLEQTLVNGDIPLRYMINKTNPVKSNFFTHQLTYFTIYRI